MTLRIGSIEGQYLPPSLVVVHLALDLSDNSACKMERIGDAGLFSARSQGHHDVSSFDFDVGHFGDQPAWPAIISHRVVSSRERTTKSPATHEDGLTIFGKCGGGL